MELTGGTIDRQTSKDIEMLRKSVDALRAAIEAVTYEAPGGIKCIRTFELQ